MIKDMGNVELFELCETNPKKQCKECLLHWNQSIVYCTCKYLLKESEASRDAIQCTLDLLSIQNYVIKNGRPHGHRYGKTKEQRDHHIAHNLRTRCIKRNFEEIPYFVNLKSNMIDLKKSVSRWTKTRRKISAIELRKKSTFDTERNGGSLSINLEKIGPMRDRSDFNDALTTLNRLHQESGERPLRPLPYWKYQERQSSSSSSSGWWQWSDSRRSPLQSTRKSTTELMCRAT